MDYRNLPQDDPTRRQPDITLARRELGWSPKVKLREGLQLTIAYFEELLRAKRRHAVANAVHLIADAPQVLSFGGSTFPWPSVGNAGQALDGTSQQVLRKAI